MGTRPLSTRPVLAAVAATALSLGCVAGLAAGPAQAKKPVPPAPVSTVLPTYPSSVVGVSPQALEKPNESGRTIRSLTMDNGKFFVGYGDYYINGGPTKVSTFDPVTRSFAETGLIAPTEEITTFRRINGKLYAPWTDPTGSGGANQGFSTNASGTWTNEFKAPAVHVFDVASLNGSDLWMVGSANNVEPGKGGAAAYRSTDGGASWSMVAKDTAGSGSERYYWAAALNGKMYFQAQHMAGAPLRVFDGTRWSTQSVTPCTTVEARAVEVFAGKLICANYNLGLVAFDGRQVTTVLPRTKGTVLDFDAPGDGYLYALSATGIFRSADGMTWTGVATTPDLAGSIGVHNGTIYLGQRLTGTIVKLDGLKVGGTAATTAATFTTKTTCKGKPGRPC